MDLLTSFVPIDRRFALAQHQSLPDHVTGAVLFADLSGFTPFTELLDHELGHKLGAEELNRLLDPMWSTIVAEVHAFAGSVMAFSGDAITCLFADRLILDLGPLESGLRRAVACGLAIQRAMALFQPERTLGGTSVSFSVKLAVVGGSVRRFDIGLPHIQMFEVLAGALLDRMAIAEQLLKAGEVGVGAEALGQFGGQLAIQEWRVGPGNEHFAVVTGLSQPIARTPWPEAPALPPEVARQWTPAPVVRRLEDTGGEFLSELRPVAALLLSFRGIDYDGDPSAQAKLNQYVGWVQAALARYEGNLLQLTMGDKGSYCHVVFGALVAHEDDPRRALDAALDLRALPASLDFVGPVRIGISHGLMYVGAHGSSQQRTFGAQGRETNVAARLMSAAKPGQILVTPHLAEAAGDRFEFRNLGAIQLKGIADPMPILAVESRRVATTLAGGRPGTTRPLVGRQPQLAALSQRLDALKAGQSSTVAIVGEAGSGKSRLMLAGLDLASQRGLPILFGAGDAVEQTASYYAWGPIFRQILGLTPEAPPATVAEHVLAALAVEPELRELAPLLNAVMPAGLEDNALTAQMFGEARANSTRDLLVTLLTRHAERSRGLVLVLEDVHLLDSASWQLLAQARQTVAPMLLIVSAREITEVASPHPEFAGILSAPDVEHLRLARLTFDETYELIRNCLGVSDVAAPVVTWTHRQAEGHPFFSEQIVLALRDSGYILIQHSRARLTDESKDLHELDFPVALQGVVTSRIDRLDATSQLALKVASVVGQVFAFRLLHDVFPVPDQKDILPERLSRIERLDLIQKTTIEPELLYAFKHSITQEVVYSLLTLVQRRQLHRSVAEWLEAHAADDLSALYSRLAHHWTQSDDSERAIAYSEKAGELALANFANEEAIFFYSQALRLDTAAGRVSDPRRRALWELRIGEALVHWTRYTEGRAHLEEGLRLLGLPALRAGGRSSYVLPFLGVMLRQGLHRLAPARFIGSRATEAGSLRAASRAFTRLVEVYYHAGETVRSTHAAFYALNLAELAGDSPELAEAYAPIAALFSFLRLQRVAEGYFKLALTVGRRTHNQAALLYVFLVLVTYESAIGHWSRAKAACERMMTIGRRLGAKRRFNDGLQLLTIVLYLHGEFAASRERAGELLASARGLRDRRFEAYALFAQACCLFYQGQPQAALQALDTLAGLFAPEAGVKDEQLQLDLYGLLAVVRLRQDDVAGALQAAAAACTLPAYGQQTSYYILDGCSGPAEVYLSLWEREARPAAYQPLARKALQVLREYASVFPIGRPRAGLFQGLYEWLTGARQRALRTWQAALGVARQLDMPYEAARLACELGSRQPTDPQAAHYLRQAYDGFERLGAMDGLERARQALEEQARRVITAG